MSKSVFIKGLRGLTALEKSIVDTGCVVTIGSFDGVHRGHQVLLKSVLSVAKERNLPSVVILFEPQPYEFFSREKAPARLMRLREKVCALFDQGIDRILCLKFNHALRSLSAEEYIQKVLVRGLGVKHLVIGDDFRFGCDRAGDYTMLQQAGKRNGFGVSDTLTLADDSHRISSTRIRELLEQDQLVEAEALLGRKFSVSGKVVYGRQLGRTMGFPTVNIGLGRYRSPVKGVYAVRVEHEGEYLNGVANVGVRPTVGGSEKPLLEVHILNFNQNLYGSFLTTIFLHKIREEKTFASLDELKAQIKADAITAQDLFELNRLN